MSSIVMSFDNPWIVGLVTGAVVIFGQWLLLLTMERRRWYNARSDFPLRTLEFAKYLTYPFHKSLIRSDGMVFLDVDFDRALKNVDDESKNFHAFVDIYAKSLPLDWLAEVSTVADHVLLASRSANRAVSAWSLLSRNKVRDGNTVEDSKFTVTEIGNIADDRLLFTGTPDEIRWKNFGQELYLCCIHLSIASKIIDKFHDRNKISSVSKVKIESGDYRIMVGEVAKYRQHLEICAELIERWKLNRLRPAA